MANINLYQTNQDEGRFSRSSTIDLAMIFAVVFFLLVMSAYGGIIFYINNLDQNIQELQDQEAEGRMSLDKEKVNRAASLQQRLELMKSQSDSFDIKNPEKALLELQKTMVGKAVVEKFARAGQLLELEMVANDLDVAAQQIENFKSNSYFSAVEVKSTAIQEDRKIKLSLKMTLNE